MGRVELTAIVSNVTTFAPEALPPDAPDTAPMPPVVPPEEAASLGAQAAVLTMAVYESLLSVRLAPGRVARMMQFT